MLKLVFIRNKKTLVYDDTCEVYNNGNLIRTFKCNTQPGTTRSGVATLSPGNYVYKPGIHGLSKPPSKRYRAFVQARPVFVFRSGSGSKLYRVDYSINIHRGSNSSVSSLGCITFDPDVWPEFRDLIFNLLDRNDQATFPVELRDKTDVAPKTIVVPTEFEYFLHGERFKPYTIQGGRAFVKVRAFIALLLKREPETLDFTWVEEDLFFNDKEIETLDINGEEGVTFGSLSSCVYAAGSNLSIDEKNKKVTIPAPQETIK